MADTPGTEGTIQYESPPELPRGVVVVKVRRSSHLWNVHHETYTTSAILAGTGEWSIRGRRYWCPPGALGFQEPGDFHQNHLYHEGTLTFDACLIPPSVLEEAASEAGVRKGDLHFRSNQVVDPDFSATFGRFHKSLSRPSTDLERQSGFAQCLELMLGRAMEGRRDPGPGRGESSACDRVRRYILDNCDRNLRLEELAAVARLPKFTLLRAFAAEYGVPPHAYHVSVRVSRATALLMEGLHPAEAAATVGFFDQSRFSYYFRRTWATTPGKFLRDISRG